MYYSFDHFRKQVETLLSRTLDGKVRWHRYGYYLKLWKVDDLLSDIAKLDDKIESASFMHDHIGQSKGGKFFSDRNMSRIREFEEELKGLKKNSRKKRKMFARSKRAIKTSARAAHSSVSHFCVRTSEYVAVIYEYDGKVIADFYQINMGDYCGYGVNVEREKAKGHPDFTLTDEECPHLITLILVLKGKNYLVDDERKEPMGCNPSVNSEQL